MFKKNEKNESSYYPFLLTASYGMINDYEKFVGIGGLHRDLSKIDILLENTKLHEEIIKLREENQQLKKQKDDVVECCKNSIKSINEKLENNKEHLIVIDGKIMCLNDYQIARLKAIRMKCKELLRMLGEIE